MHPDDQRFIQQLRQHPDHDELRLVYADWLEDRGDIDRAEFLRIELQLDQQAETAGLPCEASFEEDGTTGGPTTGDPVRLTQASTDRHGRLAADMGRMYSTIDAISDQSCERDLARTPSAQLLANWSTSAWLESVRLRYELTTAPESNLTPHPVSKLSIVKQMRWLEARPLREAKEASEAPAHIVHPCLDLENMLGLREINSREKAYDPSQSAIPYLQLHVQRRSRPLEPDEPPTIGGRYTFTCLQQICRRWFQVSWRGAPSDLRSFVAGTCWERLLFPPGHAVPWPEPDKRGYHWFGIADPNAVHRFQSETMATESTLPLSERKLAGIRIRPDYRGLQQVIPDTWPPRYFGSAGYLTWLAAAGSF